MTTAGRALDRPRAGSLSVILAAGAAVALESYDLTIFGLFALPIGHAFFPAKDATGSLLLAVATLAFGYFVRPLGGLVMGVLADLTGRKAVMVITVLTMALSTGVIGLIPGYATIGIWAPVIVLAARLVQGFFAGGATPSSIAFLAEAATPGRRGFYASWQQTSQIGAFLLSSLVAAALVAGLGSAQAGQWGWRAPFLLALVFGPASFFIRGALKEPDAFVREGHVDAPGVARALLDSRAAIVAAFGLTALWNITAFILLFYMPTYVQHQLGVSASDAFTASAVGAGFLFVLCPLVGALSDRVGAKPLMLGSALLMLAGAYPLFLALQTHHALPALIGAQCVLAVLIAGYTAPAPGLLATLFPTRSRTTGLSVAYNLSTLAIGALGPLIVTWLGAVTHSGMAPAFYVAGGAALSVATLLAVWRGAATPKALT
jgi:MHS family proline/betaine transporter-like MFS transporter